MITIKDICENNLNTKLVTLKNEFIEVVLSNYGASIFRLFYTKKNGMIVNTLVTPKNYEDFLHNRAYYGKTVGRTSGRLFLPDFKINDNIYPISSHGDDHVKLHGGKDGFSFRVFDVLSLDDGTSPSVTFKYCSKDLEEEYPGNLDLLVTYTLVDNSLKINFEATTDKDTLCNITNHAYFNLDYDKNYIYDHMLEMNAYDYIDIDEKFNFLGIKPVLDTPFDFKKSTIIKDQINQLLKKKQLGFDHPYMTNLIKDFKARLYSNETKIALNVYSDYPSVVLFTHNYKKTVDLLGIETNGIHSSLCLEAQFEPAGIHHDGLSDSILRKEDTFKKYIKFEFAE